MLPGYACSGGISCIKIGGRAGYRNFNSKPGEKEDSSTFPNHKVLLSQIQSLKAAIYAIEPVMPEDALVGAWRKSAHNIWIKRLRRTSTLVELLQVYYLTKSLFEFPIASDFIFLLRTSSIFC